MNKNTEYDPDAVHRLAGRLRRRAMLVLALWPVAGLVIGMILLGPGLNGAIGAVVGSVLGYVIGSMRALHYDVQAQNALCLKRIEENTRPR